MKKILTYCSLIVALNLFGGEEGSTEVQQGSGERKPEVKKSGYNLVSTRGEKVASTSSVRSTSRSTPVARTLSRVNLRRPTNSVISRSGSAGGTTNASSSL